MRVLSADVIVLTTRTGVDEVEFLSLNGQDIEKITGDVQLCTKLNTISLSRNRIFHGVESLMGCKQLWHIDLSSNNIKSLEGLQHFAALGSLNLSKNQLPTSELPKLKQMPIIHVSLMGNAQIESAYGSNYRRAVAVNLPHIWVLDDQLLEESDCDPRSYSMANEQSNWQNGDFSMSETESTSTVISTLAQKHIKVLGREPPINRGRDKFRLRHLARIYDDDTVWFNQQVKKMIFGNRPKLRPLNHLKSIEILSQEVRVELLVGLVAALYWNVPKIVVTEALTVLLAPHLSASIANDLSRLSVSATQSLCYVLREQIEDEATSLPGVVDALPPSVRLIVDAVPVVVVPATSYFSSNHSVSASSHTSNNHEVSSLRISLARRAAILYSRAPSCPALTASHHNAGQRKIYESLIPLLSAAVLSTGDLDPSTSSWTDETLKKNTHHTRRSSSPSINMIATTNDEDDLTLDSLALDRDGLIERLGFEGTSSPSYKLKSVQLSSSVQGGGAGAAGEELDSVSCSRESMEPCDLLHARCPKVGERVKMTAKWQKNVVHLVSSVVEDRSAFTISPSFQGNHLLFRTDVMWDPRGWWTHINAVIQSKRKAASSRRESLYRASSPDAVHRSGVACKESAFNVSLPVIKKAGLSIVSNEPSAPQLDSVLLESNESESAVEFASSKVSSSKDQVNHQTLSGYSASPVRPYISLASWDSEFVLAPPPLVDLQNHASSALGMDRPWSAIEDVPPLTTRLGRPQLPQDVPYPLQPRTSISGRVLRESLAMLPTSSEEKGRDYAGVDISSRSSSYEAELELKESMRPYDYMNVSMNSWEKLQREMGTFLSSHGHKQHERLDMASLKHDLALRRQLKEASQDLEKSEATVARSSGVFDLTTIGMTENNNTSQTIIEEKDDNNDVLEGLKELDAMAQTIRQEVEDEKDNEMGVKKASVKPWRTLTGKPQVIVEDKFITSGVRHSWESYRPTSPVNKPKVEKPPMPVHQLGIVPATKPNVLAGGRRRARTIHRPTPKGGPVIKKCPFSNQSVKNHTPSSSDAPTINSPITRSWTGGECSAPTLSSEDMVAVLEPGPDTLAILKSHLEEVASGVSAVENTRKPVPRLVSIIQQKNSSLWKKKTGKQALRELGFPIR